jgi:hypothetical protein
MEPEAPKSPLEYQARPEPATTRLPSPWKVATLAGNPIVVLAVTIVLTVLVIVVKVTIEHLRR